MIYRNLYIIFILLLKIICLVHSKKDVLNMMINAYMDDEGSSHRRLVNDFNTNYAIKHGLDFEVNLASAVTTENSAPGVKNYGDAFSSSLSSQKTKYDIVQFYSVYSKTYGQHFADLRTLIPAERHEEVFGPFFKNNLLNNTAMSEDGKIVGIPFSVLNNVLFSNKVLLDRYNKEVPKTWDQLYDTSIHIMKEEAKKNVTIIPFIDVLNDEYTSGSLNIYEFINSFRESNDERPIALTDERVKEALEFLKKLTREFGDQGFKQSDNPYYFYSYLDSLLFMNFSYMSFDPKFIRSALPGKKEGVSGTVINTTNFGINNYISEKRKRQAAEFMIYVAKKETQMKFIIKDRFYAANQDLYEDEEVCKVVECNILSDIQPYSFLDSNNRLFGNDDYYKEFQVLNQYVFNDRPLDEVLKQLDDITKHYTYSLKTNDSKVGLIVFIVFLVLLACITLSIVFVFIKKLEYRFKFLTKNLWIITTLGSLILMSSIVTLYGDVTNAKCHLRTTLINVGFMLSICPSLHKLIANFPERNEISLTFRINKYITIIILMLFTIGLNEIFAMTPYKVTEFKSDEGQRFEKCVMENGLGKVIYVVIQVFNFLIILTSLVLIFVEWNLKETSLDVKYLATALFMDTLSLILLIIFDTIPIKEYILYNTIIAMNILLFAVSNHLFIYLVRVLPIFRPDDSFEESRKFLGKVSSSGNLNGSNKRTLGNTSYNGPTYSNSSLNKNSLAFYSNLANSPYSNMGTSFYNNEAVSSINNLGNTSYNNNLGNTSSGNKNSNSSSSNSNLKYSNPSSTTYNNTYPSTKNYDPTQTNSSSGSNSVRKGGFTQKIMEYHNKTDIS